jgi:hypothetical protein
MKIYYTGYGSNLSGIHNECEFMYIMNYIYIHKKWNTIKYLAELNKLFNEYTLNDWLTYSNAFIIN